MTATSGLTVMQLGLHWQGCCLISAPGLYVRQEIACPLWRTGLVAAPQVLGRGPVVVVVVVGDNVHNV